jgi:integrase
MPPEPTGQFAVEVLADGTRAFRLRFRADGARERVVLHERPGCECGCGGGWDERAARTELGNVLARVRAGVWQPREPQRRAPPPSMPTFHQYASDWLKAKVDGVLSEKPIDANTEADYRWRLTRHLLPFFAPHRIDAIDRELCLAFKAHKLRESAEIREALAAGADLRDKQGRQVRPLGPSSIRKVIDALAAILDDAIEDELIDRNPARGKRMRVRAPKPSRTFLEMDELVALIEAAEQQDRVPAIAQPIHATASTRDRVAHLAATGMRPSAIAAEFGLAKATVSFHLRNLGAANPPPYSGRRAIVEMLGRSGLRVSELCDLRFRDIRLHDPDGARFRIPDAKTEAGIREVQMTPDLVERIAEHVERLRIAGQPTGSDAFAFPSLRGGRMTRQRVGAILKEAAALASERLQAQGKPPLPTTTPHTLRRTYISIALLANGFDVKWVMSQVGHADSKMTLDVYAQLEQRADRSHGTSFDALLRKAGGQRDDADWATFGPRAPKSNSTQRPSATKKRRRKRRFAGTSEVARPGLEPGTPRFSVVGQKSSNSAESPAFWRFLGRRNRGPDRRKLRSFVADLGTRMSLGAQCAGHGPAAGEGARLGFSPPPESLALADPHARRAPRNLRGARGL